MACFFGKRDFGDPRNNFGQPVPPLSLPCDFPGQRSFPALGRIVPPGIKGANRANGEQSRTVSAQAGHHRPHSSRDAPTATRRLQQKKDGGTADDAVIAELMRLGFSRAAADAALQRSRAKGDEPERRQRHDRPSVTKSAGPPEAATAVRIHENS